MPSFLFTIASFIVALGILITVHEFGHFWVARRLGVKVLRFSIGFGRPLWRRTGRVDGTEYVIAAIPLGGYVKMLDEREGPVPREELGRAFNRQPLKIRSAIVVAGPLFNFLFAILAFWLIFVTGDEGTRPLVGSVAGDSIAWQAGFRPGDELLAVADRPTPTWETAVYALLRESVEDRDLPVRVRDSGGDVQVRLLPGQRLARLAEEGSILDGIGLSPKRPTLPPVIGRIVPGEAAQRAGLREGDRVLRVDGRAVASWSALVEIVRDSPGRTLQLQVERDGERLTLPLTVGVREADGRRIGRIGAGVQVPEGLYDDYRAELRLGPVEAVGAATAKTWDMSLFMLRMLGRMLTGEASVKNLSGPISIAQTAGRTASYGVVYFLKFLALVSISLGVLNLLPVPVLDGGHLFFFLLEALRGSPVPEEWQLQGQRIGIAILLALMGLAFYVDIARLLE
ncbi:MAG TPA: sigma E protease regulator RseP [Sedimenticola thiotaurini]|uniref:Zinc metalloprotease n=1 Tax=Sedimenticola thiotaurini TaxID=1543721 RepID=A0A831WB00_9GAMM|nr:sigma E protease regulator RseP [Sedimenticola thiotaurini]